MKNQPMKKQEPTKFKINIGGKVATVSKEQYDSVVRLGQAIDKARQSRNFRKNFGK